jgi:hypothetical protein
MRTKSLCLAAAAVLGGLLTASAQNVYSLNVVGYVNKTLPVGFSLNANPLDDGNGNISSNLVTGLPNKSQIIVYDQVNGYQTAQYFTSSGSWNAAFALPPGKGFFVKVASGSTLTNTFVGNVAGALPGSITNSVLAGFNLVGSPYPIGGIHTNQGSNTINLPVLPNKSQVIVYDQVNGYQTAQYFTSSGAWNAAFQVDVGQGFFIKNTGVSPASWVQNVGP